MLVLVLILYKNPSWNDNDSKMTFAMYLAEQRIIPPKEFHHDPKLYNIIKETVAILLLRNRVEVPKEWRYDPEYRIVH